MYTQNLDAAFMYENERRRDEMAVARECCRVNQLLPERPARQVGSLPLALINLFLMAFMLFRRH